MKYIAVIYFIIIAIYNMQDSSANYKTITLFGNDIYYWRVIYFFFVHFTLTCLFWFARKKSIGKEKILYLGGFIFSIFYTLFQVFTLTSKTIEDYLSKVNSELWSIISFSLIVLIIIYLIIYYYDSTNKRTVD